MSTEGVGFMARDQYGQTYYEFDCIHPRKWLLDLLGRKHADKMYIDGENGEAIHIGWIIAGLWLHVYRISGLG